jgi:hypothetical protein
LAGAITFFQPAVFLFQHGRARALQAICVSFSGNRSNIKGGYEDVSTLYRSSRHSARVAEDHLYRLSTLVFGMIAMPFSPSSAKVHTIVNLRMSGT